MDKSVGPKHKALSKCVDLAAWPAAYRVFLTAQARKGTQKHQLGESQKEVRQPSNTPTPAQKPFSLFGYNRGESWMISFDIRGGSCLVRAGQGGEGQKRQHRGSQKESPTRQLGEDRRPLWLLCRIIRQAIIAIKPSQHRLKSLFWFFDWFQNDKPKKIPHRLGMGLKIPSLRWIREGQTLPAGGR